MKASDMIKHGSHRIDWHHFEQSLYDRFAVNAVTLTLNGTRKTSEDVPWANELCALIKTHPNGADKICNRLLKILLQAAQSKKKFVTGECAAGMNKWVLPIIQEDEIDGYVNICGRPFCNADRIYTEYISKTIELDAETIKKLLPCLKPIDSCTLKEMKCFIKSYLNLYYL
jgi:ligand-binding sensor protein